MKFLHVVGARPNFMKIAPVMQIMHSQSDFFEQMLVHTGQHYAENMSQVFFDDLGLPKPDVNLEVGSGSHAQQTAQIMMHFEPILLEYMPDWVVVPGDVNSTLACALVASKLGIRIAHVEAGLRSFDRSMPEEINRVITDHLADLLFTTEQSANENLQREGISFERIRFVGNTMIDTLVRLLPEAQGRWNKFQSEFGLKRFILVTIHRPSNVDDPRNLTEILAALNDIAREMPILFPIHPRTRERILKLPSLQIADAFRLLEPLAYLDFLALEAHASFVLTDSGGVQEETTYLKVPCLTVRPNTERPVTVTQGTNNLVRSTKADLVAAFKKVLDQSFPSTQKEAFVNCPELWDGRAAERIVDILRKESDLGRG